MEEMDFNTDVITRLTRIETTINNGITSKLIDHEKRVRFLEKGFYIAVGALGLLQIILSFIPKR